MLRIGLLAIFTGVLHLSATHNIGAYITVEVNSGNNCHIEVITITDGTSSADRDSIFLNIAYDGTNVDTLIIQRNNITELGNDCQRNYYKIDYIFPGPGHYTLSVADPNLTAGIKNVSNSVNVPMYVETEILLGPDFEKTVDFEISPTRLFGIENDTFFYHLHPITVNQPITFSRVAPLQGPDVAVPGYNNMNSTIHPKSGLFYVPPVPAGQGLYLFALEAKTYHNSQLTSRVHRSFLLEVNDPPLQTALNKISGFPNDSFANSYKIFIEPGKADTFVVEWKDNDTTNGQDLSSFSSELNVQEKVMTENDTVHR